jgi:hypothetical protein
VSGHDAELLFCLSCVCLTCGKVSKAANKDPVEGRLDVNTRVDAFSLFPNKKAQELTISYKEIIDLEYGQKAGRRVGAAIGTSAVPQPLISRVVKDVRH